MLPQNYKLFQVKYPKNRKTEVSRFFMCKICKVKI